MIISRSVTNYLYLVDTIRTNQHIKTISDSLSLFSIIRSPKVQDSSHRLGLTQDIELRLPDYRISIAQTLDLNQQVHRVYSFQFQDTFNLTQEQEQIPPYPAENILVFRQSILVWKSRTVQSISQSLSLNQKFSGNMIDYSKSIRSQQGSV